MSRYLGEDNDDLFDENPSWSDSFGDSAESLDEEVSRLRREIRNGRLDLRSDLVLALVDWTTQLSENGRRDEAVRRFDELIELCHILIREGQLEFRPLLGRACVHRAVEVAETEPVGRVCADFRKAIVYLDKLLGEGCMQSRGDLAEALMYLSDFQRMKGLSSSAALANAERALELWRELIDEGELEWRPVFATALISKGGLLREIGDCDAAIGAFRESEEIQRTLDEEGVPGAAVELLRCFVFQAETLSHFHHFVEAHLLFDKTIAYCRSLGKERPKDVFGWLPLLLVDKARMYRECWQFAAALKVYEQAVREFEKERTSSQQVTRSPSQPEFESSAIPESELFPPIATLSSCFSENTLESWDDYTDLRIAHIHSCCGCLLHDMDRYDDSQHQFDEAMRHYRAVEQRGIVDVRVDQCLVRLNRAKTLLDSHHDREAVEIQLEAIQQLITFIKQGKDCLRINLAQAYREVGSSLSSLGRDEDALESIENSITLWRELLEEGHLDKREQLAHSLLVRSDYFLEKDQIEKSLEGYLESVRIRNELFEEGDWLVALPLVHTLFSLSKNYYLLHDDQLALQWSIESLKILELIRQRGILCVDYHILEGTRRCLGFLVNMGNADAVLRELDKIFLFIRQLHEEGRYDELMDEMIPHFRMYAAHAWRLKGETDREIRSISEAIRCWEDLLTLHDSRGNPEEEEEEEKRNEFHAELDNAIKLLAAASRARKVE